MFQIFCMSNIQELGPLGGVRPPLDPPMIWLTLTLSLTVINVNRVRDRVGIYSHTDLGNRSQYDPLHCKGIFPQCHVCWSALLIIKMQYGSCAKRIVLPLRYSVSKQSYCIQ